jgi:hypothetical protein
MSDYDTWLKQHLAAYKTNRLGVSEHGLWRRNGQPYPHILPEALYKLNIVETYRHQFWRYASEHHTLKRHRDFHHLNSSQAMCFNLFYPFFADMQEHVLVDTLDFPHEPITEYAFERVLDPSEGTNFDFYLRFRSGRQVFFELKLSESGFGTARADARHHDKFATIYRSRLAGNVAPAYLEAKLFFRHYQLLRNISYLHVDTDDRLVFIFPLRNRNLVKEYDALLANVAASVASKIRVVHLETFVDFVLQKACFHNAMFRTHYRLFQEKYIGEMLE